MIEKETQVIKLNTEIYKINIYIKINKLSLEIYSNNNNGNFFNEEYSFELLKSNKILRKYTKIQEIYDFLNKIINSKNYHLIIEDYPKIIKLIINFNNEKDNIIFTINKENDVNDNNFENILNDIEKDMNLLDPFIKELKDENKKITEENIKLKIEIKALKEENQMLLKKLNDSHLNKRKSKDNIVISKNYNNKEENVKKNENKVIKKGNQNPDSKKQNSNENKINSKNDNNNQNYIFSNELKDQIYKNLNDHQIFKNKEISFQLLYKAKEDNDSAESFHEKVDNKGPIIVIIKTNEDKIIGGFTSKSWTSDNKFVNDDKAFLFKGNKIYFVKYKDKACNHKKDEGPHFGDKTLIIFNNCFKNGGECNNDTYQFNNNYNLFTKRSKVKFEIKDYEVYAVKSK